MEQASLWLACLHISLSSFTPYMHCLRVEREQMERYQKQVRHFLMEAVGGDTALHDQEYDLVEWFPISEACRRLTYQNEVNILYQAEDVLQRWLEYQRKEGQK